MGKPITIGQSHNLISVLVNNVDWNEVGSDGAQWMIEHPKDSGAQFTAFLKNVGRVLASPTSILAIDRTTPFNPERFIGKDWRIEEEEDERSLALTEVDLTKVRLESYIKPGEHYITGEENLKCLKARKRIRLDAKIFQTLWENQQFIPESWKEKGYIFFDGTVLRGPSGRRCVLYLYWSGGRWRWVCLWLGLDRSIESPSAVLASS